MLLTITRFYFHFKSQVPSYQYDRRKISIL